ncbi:MAG: O-antigen ligase family protein [Acidobacteriota bacterium]
MVRMASPPDPSAAEARRPWAFWLYAGHLLSLPALAASNILGGLALLASPRYWRRAGGTPARRRLLCLLALYSLLLVAAVAFSYEPGQSLTALSELFTLTTLVLGLALIADIPLARRLVDALILLGLIVALLGLAQLTIGFGDLEQRIRGPFSHWMTFSHFLLVCDLLLLGRLAAGTPPRKRWLRWGRWVALAILNIALLVSLTRSAWLGLAVAVTLLVVLKRPRWLLAYVPAAVLIVLLLPVPVLHRVASIGDLTDPSNYDRLCMAEAGLRMIAQRPLFGLGPEQVEERYAIYRSPSAPRYWVPHLHNSFLQLAAERGLPALAVYLALMVTALAAAWRGFRSRGGFATGDGDLHLATLLALVAFNVAGLFENNWADTEVQRLVLFVLALPFVGEAER